MKVLLADDSVLILDRLQQMLGAFEQVEIVATCKNGLDTLNALKTLKPDLAIVDIKMPGISGLEVLSEIRKVDKVLKFIILTFYSSDSYRQLAIKAGVDHFISKVDDFEKVSLLVADMLKHPNRQSNIITSLI
ncbi:MAG: response regulator transcription factor [Bacteroidota bacterium]